MRAPIVRQLNRLNRRFYEARGAAFDRRRDHAWPGFDELRTRLPAVPEEVLDVGCGNARFGAWLSAVWPDARYLGFDASVALLRRARARDDLPPASAFVRGDFVESPDALPSAEFDLVVCFGVLHHVPGRAARRALVDALAARVRPGGCLALSVWRFGAFDRFERLRLSDAVPPELASAFEREDALLSFDGDATVPRYCRAIGSDEFDALLPTAAGRWTDAFCADGREGSLNEYRLWSRR